MFVLLLEEDNATAAEGEDHMMILASLAPYTPSGT
jgi:hypothetical protein